MNLRNQKGFTLIELVLVITILGILAIAALPQFIDVSTNAATAAHQGVAGAVSEGVALFRANDLVANGPPGNYPAALDALANGTQCGNANPCFVNVLENGVTAGEWTKTNATTYTYTSGAVTQQYVYTAGNGTFLPQ